MLFYKLRGILDYWRGFLTLARIGICPAIMLRLSLGQRYWRDVIASGNGDLYISIE